MRAAIPGLPTPYPLGTLMPALYQEDSFTMRWTSGLDEALAPIIATIDCLAAYLDPLLTPDDFLLWLGSWVGAALEEEWPAERRRAVVAESVDLYRHRGTADGLRRHLELVTGCRVDVTDSGGAVWSLSPNSTFPSEPDVQPWLRVLLPDRAEAEIPSLELLLASAKPAHISHTIGVGSA